MPEIEEMRQREIQELRRAMGTLPSERPPLKTDLVSLETSIKITLVSTQRNPYIPIFEGACATWGDDNYSLKWPLVSPPNRFKVCLAALTGQTLPQALEVVNFMFQVKGTPRWLFEEHAREMSQFTTYFSVGCRDNNKLDASMMVANVVTSSPDYFIQSKENYRKILEEGEDSWQSARSVLPMSYHHPYFFATSLLALISAYRTHQDGKSGHPDLGKLLLLTINCVAEKYPLIGYCIKGMAPNEGDYEKLQEIDRNLFTGGLV